MSNRRVTEQDGMDVLLVRLSRGRTAIAQFDPALGVVTTDHPGLQALGFHEGIRGFDGGRCWPRDGRAFLAALYDRLFLCGYHVQWLGAGSTVAQAAKRAPEH